MARYHTPRWFVRLFRGYRQELGKEYARLALGRACVNFYR